MSTFINVLLEIIKISVPALIVYFTVHSLMKQYLEKQYQMRLLEMREAQQSSSTPLRFQAFERLSLFCERISPPNLILRIRRESMSSNDLKVALMLAIQQEYEHNITQQVYVSDQLWAIIKMARDNTVAIINGVAEKVGEEATGKELAGTLMHLWNNQEQTPTDTALLAIKKEAGFNF